MFPLFVTDNAADLTFAHSKLAGNRTLTPAASIQLPNLTNLCICQLCFATRLPLATVTMMPAVRNTLLNIILLCSSIQMERITARRIITTVQDI